MTAPEPADTSYSEIQTRLTQILRRPAGPESAQAMRGLRDIPFFRDTPGEGARILSERLSGRPTRDLPAIFWLFAADVYFRADQPDECRNALLEAFNRDLDMLEPIDLARGYQVWGLLEASENNWETAVSAWSECLTLLPPESDREIQLLKRLGEGWEALGVADRAHAIFYEALKLAALKGAVEDECEVLCLLGRHHHDHKSFDEAATYFLYAVRRAQEERYRPGEAAGEVGYGGLCLEMGELDVAEEALNRGLERARSLGDPLLQIHALERLAELEETCDRPESARSALEEAIFLSKGCGAGTAQACLHHRLAMLHEGQSRISLAMGAYEKALTERRRAGDPAGLGATLNNLGSLYERMGDGETASRFYRESLLAFGEAGHERREIEVVLENLRRLGSIPRNGESEAPQGSRSGTDPAPVSLERIDRSPPPRSS